MRAIVQATPRAHAVTAKGELEVASPRAAAATIRTERRAISRPFFSIGRVREHLSQRQEAVRKTAHARWWTIRRFLARQAIEQRPDPRADSKPLRCRQRRAAWPSDGT